MTLVIDSPMHIEHIEKGDRISFMFAFNKHMYLLHAYTYMHIPTYIYTYMCACMCVCVCETDLLCDHESYAGLAEVWYITCVRVCVLFKMLSWCVY